MREWLQWSALSMLGLTAGASLIVQAILNNRLRSGLASWSWTGLVSYLGGTVTMAAVLLLQRQAWPLPGARGNVPWWAWAGGFFGAAYIVLAIVLVPRLGAATTVALVVAGQMLSSVAFDHFGLLGLSRHAASPARLFGVALLVAAVVLIRG